MRYHNHCHPISLFNRPHYRNTFIQITCWLDKPSDGPASQIGLTNRLTRQDDRFDGRDSRTANPTAATVKLSLVFKFIGLSMPNAYFQFFCFFDRKWTFVFANAATKMAASAPGCCTWRCQGARSCTSITLIRGNSLVWVHVSVLPAPCSPQTLYFHLIIRAKLVIKINL